MSTILLILVLQLNASAQMVQHGFILSNDDTFGSHLVANGHHSRQVEIVGQLIIPNGKNAVFYHHRKLNSYANQSYFLFQAQQLDLPRLAAGMVLTGHIIESDIGGYDPKNVVVPLAIFRVQRVLLNIPNPFFTSDTQQSLFRQNNYSERLNAMRREPRHCCDTGSKPCNWKC